MLNPVGINGLRCYKEEKWRARDYEIMHIRDIWRPQEHYEGGAFADEMSERKKPSNI